MPQFCWNNYLLTVDSLSTLRTHVMPNMVHMTCTKCQLLVVPDVCTLHYMVPLEAT
jgi:hypothetical protein